MTLKNNNLNALQIFPIENVPRNSTIFIRHKWITNYSLLACNKIYNSIKCKYERKKEYIILFSLQIYGFYQKNDF